VFCFVTLPIFDRYRYSIVTYIPQCRICRYVLIQLDLVSYNATRVLWLLGDWGRVTGMTLYYILQLLLLSLISPYGHKGSSFYNDYLAGYLFSCLSHFAMRDV
jgi:hypothetical protein